MPSLNVLPPTPQPAAPQPAAAPAQAGPGTRETAGERFADTLDARMKAPGDAAPAPAAPPGGAAQTAETAADAPEGAEAAAAAAALALLGALTQQANAQPATEGEAIAPEAASDATAGLAAPLATPAGTALAAAIPAAQTQPAPGAEAQAAAQTAGATQAASLPTAAAGTDPDSAGAQPRPAPGGQPLPGAADTAAAVATPGAPAARTEAAVVQSATSFEQALTAASATQTGAVPRESGTRVEAPQFPVQTPAHQRGWADEVGQRMVWMAGKDLGKAELVLTPPHLGRVEISLSVNGDQATAQFVAATPAAREALEQALPRLKEVMNQAGLSLSQANVSANGAHDQAAREGWRGAARGGGQAAGGEADGGANGLPAAVRSGVGLVDTFA